MGDYGEILDSVDRHNPFFSDDLDASLSKVSLNLSLKPGSLLHILRESRGAILEGHLWPDLPMETEIALYDHLISQLEHKLAHSWGKERDLIDRWHNSIKKSEENLQRLK